MTCENSDKNGPDQAFFGAVLTNIHRGKHTVLTSVPLEQRDVRSECAKIRFPPIPRIDYPLYEMGPKKKRIRKGHERPHQRRRPQRGIMRAGLWQQGRRPIYMPRYNSYVSNPPLSFLKPSSWWPHTVRPKYISWPPPHPRNPYECTAKTMEMRQGLIPINALLIAEINFPPSRYKLLIKRPNISSISQSPHVPFSRPSETLITRGKTQKWYLSKCKVTEWRSMMIVERNDNSTRNA